MGKVQGNKIKMIHSHRGGVIADPAWATQPININLL